MDKSYREIVRDWYHIPAEPVEIRRKRDGTWALWYPDPGFVPCMCGANIPAEKRTAAQRKCLAETKAGPKLLEMYTHFETLEDALVEAAILYPNTEPKVIGVETASERQKRVWAERRESRSS